MDESMIRLHRIQREARDLAVRTKQVDLYKAAAGMPARSQASKEEIARWLLTYAPERVAALKG